MARRQRPRLAQHRAGAAAQQPSGRKIGAPARMVVGRGRALGSAGLGLAVGENGIGQKSSLWHIECRHSATGCRRRAAGRDAQGRGKACKAPGGAGSAGRPRCVVYALGWRRCGGGRYAAKSRGPGAHSFEPALFRYKNSLLPASKTPIQPR